MGKMISFFGLIILTIFILTTFWTQRTVEFWWSQMAGNAVDISFWEAFLFNILFGILGAASIWLNLISEIVRILFFRI